MFRYRTMNVNRLLICNCALFGEQSLYRRFFFASARRSFTKFTSLLNNAYYNNSLCLNRNALCCSLIWIHRMWISCYLGRPVFVSAPSMCAFMATSAVALYQGMSNSVAEVLSICLKYRQQPHSSMSRYPWKLRSFTERAPSYHSLKKHLHRNIHQSCYT